MAADSYLQFSGLWYLPAGTKVSVTIGGLDCGDTTVDSTGTLYVLLGADTGGLLTASYIVGLDGATGENATDIYFDDGSGPAHYTIPVVIGLPYTSQMQLLRPSTADDIKSPTGGALGKKRRIHRFAALLQNCISGALYFGTSFSAIRAAALRDATDAPGSELDGLTMFNGVYRSEIDDDYGFDGQLCAQINRPSPATIVQIAGHLEAEED